MPVPYVSPRFQAFDGNGNPLVGGKLYTYVSTTTTPQITYLNADGTAANTNPIILDSLGEGVIYLSENVLYTFVLKDENDALIWSQDGIAGNASSAGGITVVTAIPASDVGPVYIAGQGIFSWDGTKYVSDYSGGFGGGGYSFRNKIINGDFRSWTSGTPIGPVTGGIQYTADQWQIYAEGSVSLTAAQMSASSDFGQGRVGGYTAKVTSNAVVTPAAGNRAWFTQPMEGLSVLDFALGSIWGGSFTLSFWVKASVVGTYSVAFMNGGSPGPRSYISNYSIANAGAWEFKTVTVPCDQSGIANWDRSNGIGLRVAFDMGSGSSLEGVPNTWLSTSSSRTTGSVRLIATAGATIEFGNVQLEIGVQATPYEFRPNPVEVQLCERYYMLRSLSARFTAAAAGNTMDVTLVYPRMRTTPASALVTTGSRVNVSTAAVSNFNNGSSRFEIVSAGAGDTYAVGDVWTLNARM